MTQIEAECELINIAAHLSEQFQPVAACAVNQAIGRLKAVFSDLAAAQKRIAALERLIEAKDSEIAELKKIRQKQGEILEGYDQL